MLNIADKHLPGNYWHSVKITDVYLLAEFLILVACVFASVYFQSDGFLSTDSTSYLALAKSLLNTHSFYVSGYGYTGAEKDYFAIWPVAYPVLIAMMAKLSGLSIFWSSKLANVLMAGCCLLIFRKIFAEKAYIYGYLFLFGAAIVIHCFTWSEPLFIFGLIAYATITASLLQHKNTWLLSVLLLAVISQCLFLTRYIGAFSIIVTGLLGVYCLFNRHPVKKGLALFAVAGINLLLIWAYLHYNLAQTHYITGMPRIPAQETHWQLVLDLTRALLSACIIPIPHLFFRPEILAVIVIQLVCVLIFFRKQRVNAKQPISYCVFSQAFMTTGVMYLLSIIILRWFTHFDTFYFKLVFPGALLIFIALIRHIDINYPVLFKPLSRVLGSMTALTVCMVPVVLYSLKDQPTYNDTVKTIEKEYAAIAPGSVIAFGNMHVKYLREDLLLWTPWSLPYDEKMETWNDFLQRVGNKKAGNNRSIYLAAPAEILGYDFDKSIYDKSVVQLIRQNKNKGISRIR